MICNSIMTELNKIRGDEQMAQKITVLQALDKSLRATKTYIDNTVSNIDSIMSNKVDKIDGKGLSTNDFTDELKSRYEIAYAHSLIAHAPANAQKNSDITKNEIEAKLIGEIDSHTHNWSDIKGKPECADILDEKLVEYDEKINIIETHNITQNNRNCNG